MSGGEPVFMTSENLVSQLRERSAEALSFLIHAHADATLSLASHILAGVGTPEDIEECVSEVFFRLGTGLMNMMRCAAPCVPGFSSSPNTRH